MGSLFSMAAFSCFLILSASMASSSQQQRFSNISLGSSLKPSTNSSWLSPSGLYAFGFYKLNEGYAVGIFLAGIPEKTVVWTANRDDPVFPSPAALLFSNDGRLILQQEDRDDINIVVVGPGQSVVSASMLDSGNFVLYGSSQRIAWQSFDNPTDTLLQGQRLPNGKEIFSSASEMNPARGIFRLKMQDDGNLVQYPVDTPDAQDYAYYGSCTFFQGSNVSLNLDNNGNLYLFNGISVIRNLTTGRRRRRTIYLLRIDVDGILRLYYRSLDPQGNWTKDWSPIDNKCAPLGLCGLNGFCILMDDVPVCECLPGFNHIKSGNLSSGCERNFSMDGCKAKDQNVSYEINTLDNIIWADNNYEFLKGMDKDNCKKTCLDDCNCDAALFFENGYCKKQRLPLRYGRRLQSNSNVALIKVSTTTMTAPSTPAVLEQHKYRWWVWLTTALSGTILLAFIILFLCYLRNFRPKSKKVKQRPHQELEDAITLPDKYNKTSDKIDKKMTQVQFLSFESIAMATNNFSTENKLGEGGFGPVYKGKLPGGKEIAIKRLSRSSGQGLIEFKNEILLIAKVQHINLVKLLGCCIEREEKILVYEYMPNKSLDYFLFDHSRRELLNWTNRLNIINGVARGLVYLHEFSRLKVIHRDLKAGNILLDQNMNPKISDFGLARIFGAQQSEANTNRIVGTYGYMAPEYAGKGIVSTKTDVFSFGVLVLEIISGKKNYNSYDSEHTLNLIGFAWELWMKGRILEVMDSTLDDLSFRDQMVRCINVGLLCVQDNAADRPSMKDVVSMLTNDSVRLPAPKQPAFYIETGARGTRKEISLEKKCTNGLTISVMEAR